MDKKGFSFRKIESKLTFYLFLLPALSVFSLVIVIPFIFGIYYSFTDWNAVSGAKINWLGFENYKMILADVKFLHAFLITMLYAVLNIVAVNLVAFPLALLVTGKLKFTNLYRAAFFIPNLIGGIILGYIWQFIFNNILPALGKAIGFQPLAELLMLADTNLALLGIIIVGTWQYAGYIMMIYIASIQAVPSSLLESASIDGANYLEQLRHIMFPLIAPAFTVSMFLTLVNSFKQFDVNYALTAGGPAGMFMNQSIMTNEFLALNIYNTAFAYHELAQGQAKAIIFFLVLTLIALVQVYYNKRKEIEM